MRLPLIKRRKVGMTSNHHAPYDLGYTRNTMAQNRGKQSREVEQIPKRRPSSDRRLQLACVKSELLVIADQHAAVKMCIRDRFPTMRTKTDSLSFGRSAVTALGWSFMRTHGSAMSASAAPTVSYTHLDVYKRQSLWCPEATPLATFRRRRNTFIVKSS